MASNDIHDLTIIGAGPAGLFAAYYAGFRGLRTKLIDSQPDLGGQVTALYPDKLIYDVAGFPKILGKDLYFAVRQKEDFRGKHLLVIGGGDSALDWALGLVGYATEITLIHRRDAFRAHEDSVKKLYASPIKVKTFYELRAIRGDNQVREAVVFRNKTQAEEVLKADAVLAFLGLVSNLGPIREWGLQIQDDSIVVNTKMETTMPGVYAAGDVTIYPGKLKVIATGFGEAATAINNAVTYVNPNASAFPGHSSTIMEKKEKTAAKAGAS